MQDNFDAVNKLSEANAKLATATELYNQLSKQAKDAQAKADALQKALDACKDQPSTPGDDNKPSQGEDNKPGSNAGNNSGNTNNSGTTTVV